jgi:type II secretory pathway component PulF
MGAFYTVTYMMPAKRGFRKVQADYFLPNQASVRREIAKLGGTIVSIEARKQAWFNREFFSRDYKVGFLRAVSFQLGAGISPGRSLALVITGETNPSKRRSLEPALEVLNRGGSFLESVEALQMFDHGTLSILSAGELVGSIRDVINSAIEHMEEKGKTWKILLAAFGWLWFDISTGLSAVAGVQWTALPWLRENGISSKDAAAVEKFNHALNMAYIFNTILLVVAIAAIGFFTIIGLSYLFFGTKKRHLGNVLLGKVGFLHRLMVHTGFGETFYVVGRMLKGHVQFSEALKVAIESAGIDEIRTYWKEVHKKVLQGDTIDHAMSSDYLTRPELLQISAHQDSAQLARVVLNIAAERTEAARRGLRKVVSGAVVATILYTVASVGNVIYVVAAQGSGLNSTMDGVSNGGQ